jgi:hypothetical protein
MVRAGLPGAGNYLLLGLDFGGGEGFFAVLFLNGAGDGDFFSVGGADLVVEVLADVVLVEEVVDGFTVFIDLEDVLAFIGDMQFAFGADQHAGEGDRAGGIVGQGGEGGGAGDEGGDEREEVA